MISGNGMFKEGSPETDLLGSGLYEGVVGKFSNACFGSCQAQGSLTNDWQPGAVEQAEIQMKRLNEVEVMLDLLSGAQYLSDQ